MDGTTTSQVECAQAVNLFLPRDTAGHPQIAVCNVIVKQVLVLLSVSTRVTSCDVIMAQVLFLFYASTCAVPTSINHFGSCYARTCVEVFLGCQQHKYLFMLYTSTCVD